MKSSIVVLLVVVVLISVYAYPIVRAKNVSKKIQEHTIAYEQHPTTPTAHVLVIGDSTGVGTGARMPEDSIAGRIGKEYPNADITNSSINGIRLEEVVAILNSKPDAHYDLIVVQIGANDVTGFTSYTKISDRLNSVLSYTSTHALSTIILTAGNIGNSPVFIFPFSYLITHRTRAVRAIFMEVVKKYPSVHYVDLFTPAVDDAFASAPHTYYAADHFHPTSEGYALWYPYVRDSISKTNVLR